MRLADPPADFCSVCFNANPQARYVDFEVSFDGRPVLKEDGTIAMSPVSGLPMQHDLLFVCETCWREACELLGLKPELHARQLREIQRQGIEIEHWRATAKRLQAELSRQVDANIEAAPAPPRGPGRPRKVPVA